VLSPRGRPAPPLHDHVAASIRRGQGAGLIAADRNPDAEAWVMIAGALLRSVADRVGGLLDDGDLAALQKERIRVLLPAPVTGCPSGAPRKRAPPPRSRCRGS